MRNVKGRSRAEILALAFRGLGVTLGLKAKDAARLFDSVCPIGWVTAGELIVFEDDCPDAKLIVRGWACESRMLADGRRQIFDFLLPGGICFPPGGAMAGTLEVRALTTMRVLSLEPALRRPHAPELAEVLHRAYELNLTRRYDTAVRLGQLTAEERTMDLLEEFRERLEALDLVKEESFRLPLNQAQLADGLGLSLAHLNRTIATLRRQAQVDIRSGQVRLAPRRTPRSTMGTQLTRKGG